MRKSFFYLIVDSETSSEWQKNSLIMTEKQLKNDIINK